MLTTRPKKLEPIPPKIQSLYCLIFHILLSWAILTFPQIVTTSTFFPFSFPAKGNNFWELKFDEYLQFEMIPRHQFVTLKVQGRKFHVLPFLQKSKHPKRTAEEKPKIKRKSCFFHGASC